MDGPAIYEKIMNLLDLSSGVAQDLVRQKFNALSVQPTDTMNKVITAVDQKYYLYTKHTLMDSVTESGQREGIRLVTQMLLKAHDHGQSYFVHGRRSKV